VQYPRPTTVRRGYYLRPSSTYLMDNPLYNTHAFVVRIWWEPGLTRPNGHPLWRGQVQHAASGRTVVFQTLDELLHFIQDQTGDLEPTDNELMNR